MTTTRSRGSYIDRPSPSSLADVINIILDKGLVIDAFIRVSVVGIELITIDARIVIASVDTYLRFAEATSRLNLQETGGKDLMDLTSGMMESGASSKTKGMLQGAKESLFGSDDDDSGDEQEQQEERKPQQRRRPARKENA
jgi:hypothetical protein